MPMVEDRVAARDLQVVVLSLAGKQYGVNIARVLEILRPVPITHVPYTPEYLEGVMNLRGRVVPVIDPRVRFGLGKALPGRESRIVVADIAGSSVGLLVDAVADILTIGATAQQPNTVTSGIDAAYITSFATVDDRQIILLDLSRLLNDDEQEVTEGND